MNYLIAVVDDDPQVRKAITGLLREFEFDVESFGCPKEFLSQLPREYHCVLLDERMQPNGVETFQQMRILGCQSPAVMVTGVATARLTMDAIELGFSYVSQKPINEKELIPKVRGACESYVKLLDDEQRKARQHAILDSLSDRERQVLKYVADGFLNKQIASHLGVGLRTVETYRNRVMQKIGAKSAADAIAFAISVGMRDSGVPASIG